MTEEKIIRTLRELSSLATGASGFYKKPDADELETLGLVERVGSVYRLTHQGEKRLRQSAG